MKAYTHVTEAIPKWVSIGEIKCGEMPINPIPINPNGQSTFAHYKYVSTRSFKVHNVTRSTQRRPLLTHLFWGCCADSYYMFRWEGLADVASLQFLL